MIDI
jgi:hypothetical protein